MEDRAARGQGAAAIYTEALAAPCQYAYWRRSLRSTAPPTTALLWLQVDYLGSQRLKHFDIPFDGEVAEAPTPEDDKLVLARMKARLETEGEEDDAEEENAEKEEEPAAKD